MERTNGRNLKADAGILSHVAQEVPLVGAGVQIEDSIFVNVHQRDDIGPTIRVAGGHMGHLLDSEEFLYFVRLHRPVLTANLSSHGFLLHFFLLA